MGLDTASDALCVTRIKASNSDFLQMHHLRGGRGKLNFFLSHCHPPNSAPPPARVRSKRKLGGEQTHANVIRES